MSGKICLHHLALPPGTALAPFVVAACTRSRQELLAALGVQHPVAVVLDLDRDDAVDTIVAALELSPQLAIVGATDGTDLNRVIAAQRVGCAQVTTKPLDPQDLVDALSRAQQRVAQPAQATVISLIGAIGGAGTTTLACHLAVELAAIQDTALIDLDLEFGGVARAFDLHPRHTLLDLARAGTVDGDLLRRVAQRLPLGVDVIAAPDNIHAAHEIDETCVQNVLRAARAAYASVVLDLPRRLDAMTAAALEASSRLLIVTQLTLGAIENTRRLLLALQREGLALERIEIVVNRYRRSAHSCTVEMLERQLSKRASAVIPNDYQAVREAADFGKPLGDRNPVRAAIATLAVTLTGGAERTERPGWLARLRRGGRTSPSAS